MGEPKFRFRLNGEIIQAIRIEYGASDGNSVGKFWIAVRDEDIGWFAIDDNENLWDKDLPKFVLEYRNETAWSLIPVIERQSSKDKGWTKVTTQELLDVLESAGIIKHK